jgi:hypothetical protein
MLSSIAERSFHRTGPKIFRRAAIAAVAALLGVSTAPLAHAGFTEAAPNQEGEPSQGSILSHVLGGTFTANGNNFTNGSLTATQLDDVAEQIWQQPIISAQAVAAFSEDPEIFGFIGGTGPGNFTPLFTASGTGYDVTGSTGPAVTPSSYQLARSGTDTFSSVSADNSDKDVHLLAYSITGLPNQAPDTRTWMLFWEDTIAQYSDWDYNDLVVKLVTDPPASSDTPPPVLIPLPSAAWSGLSGLAVLLVVCGVGRMRRQIA